MVHAWINMIVNKKTQTTESNAIIQITKTFEIIVSKNKSLTWM